MTHENFTVLCSGDIQHAKKKGAMHEQRATGTRSKEKRKTGKERSTEQGERKEGVERGRQTRKKQSETLTDKHAFPCTFFVTRTHAEQEHQPERAQEQEHTDTIIQVHKRWNRKMNTNGPGEGEGEGEVQFEKWIEGEKWEVRERQIVT